jgi:hypothetical protein
MKFLERHPKISFIYMGARDFFEHPFRTLWRGSAGSVGGIKGLGLWLWHALTAAALYLWAAAKAHRMGLYWVGVAVAAVAVLLTVTFCGAMIYIDGKMAPVARPDQIVYLRQGWGDAANSQDRVDYYYSPQGAFVHNLRYDWMAKLERPWQSDRFADAHFMRSYGFIVDEAETSANPGRLPVGFAPRYDPAFGGGEMMLDLTCAACHTGELQIVKDGIRSAVRIDGGSGHHDFTTVKPGRFAADLFASLTATYFNPLKFRRFARTVLMQDNTWGNWRKLHGNLGDVLWDILVQAVRERRRGVYPIEEGFGRTDGLGRILNTAFAVNLDFENYHVANAPVSYPFIWEIPWFNWVQYTGSVRQPMARNIGEAMGTGARYYLRNPYGQPLPASERFDASLKIANLNNIERLIRRLTPPCWPEDLFGKIDQDKATQGADLFHNKFKCVHCHGPIDAPNILTAAEAPFKLAAKNPALREGPQPMVVVNAPPVSHLVKPLHWIVQSLSVEDIGTDPTSALNFVRYRIDLSKSGMSADEVRTELTPYYTVNYGRQVEFYVNLVNSLQMEKPDAPSNPFLSAGQNTRDVAALAICKMAPPIPAYDTGNGPGELPVPLAPLTKEQKEYLGDPTTETACAGLAHLIQIGVAGYLNENVGGVQLNQVSMGAALNYLITLVRKRAYQDLGIMGQDRVWERNTWDGYAQLDTPTVKPQYQARPLAGVWATPPFLHNGSVPSLYELFLPAYRRSKQFYRRQPLFDPRAIGLYSDSSEKGAFLFDTALPGNSNSGHEFRNGYRPWKAGDPPSYGVIGPEMTDDERWAIIEYLKVRRDRADAVCPEEKFVHPEKKK